MFWKKTKPSQNEMRIENPMLIALRNEDHGGSLMVNLDPVQLGTPEEAGVILADISRHMAQALVMTGAAEDSERAFQSLKAVFDAEAEAPTQAVSGGIRQ